MTPGDTASKQQIQDQTQACLTPSLGLVQSPVELEAGRGPEGRNTMAVPLSSGRGRM